MKHVVWKRIACLMIALALMCASAMAETENYSLRERFVQQSLKQGIGISARLVMEGESEWLKPLMPLNGVMIQLRGNAASDAGNDFRYMLFLGSSDAPSGITRLWGRGKTLYLQSDLLMGMLYSLPIRGDILTTLTSGETATNPSFWSAVFGLANVQSTIWQEKWVPQLNTLRDELEFWLDRYAEVPQIIAAQGGSLLKVHYEIPAEDVKAEMKSLLVSILANQELTALINGLMQGEQQRVYLSAGYGWYYNRMIENLDLPGSVVLERVTSTMGEPRSIRISLPLSQSAYGFRRLELTEEDDAGQTVLLEGDALTLSWTRTRDEEESGIHQGSFRILPAEGTGIAAAYRARAVTEQTEADGLQREITTWDVELTQDTQGLEEEAAQRCLTFDPIMARLRTTFSGKGDSSAQTELTVDVTVSLPDGRLSMRARLLTMTEQDLDMPDSVSGAVDLSKMTAIQRQGILADWLANALVMAGSAQEPEEIPVPQEPATPSDIEAEVLSPVTEEPSGQGGGLVQIGPDAGGE